MSRVSRNLFFLPSLFTTANLLCGFLSLLLAAQAQFLPAAGLILLGILLDNLDGQVARWLGISTAFGVEYDSLADMVTFGLAPSFLWAMAWLAPLGRWGWASTFLFAVGAALRLARFNIQHETPKSHFVGLPSPGAAGTLAALTLSAFRPWGTNVPAWLLLLAALLPPVLSFLMVSTLPYPHFKQVDEVQRLLWLLIGVAVLIALALAIPQWVLPLVFCGYTLLGPLHWFWGKLWPRKR